ncbi:hypothetical protein CEXT_740981 [Caerostris extrusa]|uniref:Uncharacterized protein n=1 Tax=Caerostris extrusa TaxID=172846 RepID=A0AAV4XNE1_CAEEX|nr:hypothetical protein CEXT_740981 [Caerostris extrusa]
MLVTTVECKNGNLAAASGRHHVGNAGRGRASPSRKVRPPYYWLVGHCSRIVTAIAECTEPPRAHVAAGYHGIPRGFEHRDTQRSHIPGGIPHVVKVLILTELYDAECPGARLTVMDTECSERYWTQLHIAGYGRLGTLLSKAIAM